MQRADQHPPAKPTDTPAVTARRRRGSRLRSRPQPRPQEMAALEWQRHGACRRVDQSVFFAPDTPGEPRAERRRRLIAAKHVCAQCPVLELCREYALENQEEFGVWGGLSEAERSVLIAARRRRDRSDGGGPAVAPPPNVPRTAQV